MIQASGESGRKHHGRQRSEGRLRRLRAKFIRAAGLGLRHVAQPVRTGRPTPSVVAIGAAVAALISYILPSPFLEWAGEPFHDLRVSLVVFSLLTITFEGITRHHMDRAVEGAVGVVKDASTETILRYLMGDAGYASIQPYMDKVGVWRTFAHLCAALSWTSDTDRLVVHLTFCAHVVKSADAKRGSKYTIAIEEDREKLIRGEASTLVEAMQWNNVAQDPMWGSVDGAVRAQREVDLKPGTSGVAYTAWQIETGASDHYDFSMWYVTEQLLLTIVHPPEIEVTAGGMGFARVKLEPKGRSDRQHEWQSRLVLLPDQGVSFKWRRRPTTGPVPDEVEGHSETNGQAAMSATPPALA